MQLKLVFNLKSLLQAWVIEKYEGSIEFMKITKIVLLFISLGITFPYEAAGVESSNDKLSSFIHNNFNIHNQIWGIQIDPSNGMAYFASNTGLMQFDGLAWKTFELPRKQPLRSVCMDTSGKIYTGCFEEFGYWQENANCELEYHSLSNSIDIALNDEIWKIYILGEKVYFQSFTTIYEYDGSQIVSYEAPDFMLFMFPVGDKFIAQLLNKGLYYFADGSFTLMPDSEQFRDKKVHAILYENDSSIIICTEKHGLFIKDEKGIHYWNSEISDYLKYESCNAAIILNEDSYLFGTILNGIVFVNKKGQIESEYNHSNGLNNNTVLCISGESSKGVWIGLDQGVNFIDKNKRVDYFSTLSGSLGAIYAVLQDKNKLYLGSNHGLYVADILKKGNSYSFNDLTFIPKSQGQVWTLSKQDNQILCGHNEGTFLIRNNALQKISTVTGGWTIKPMDDNLIEGTYTGLALFDKNEQGLWQFKSKIAGFHEPSRYLELDYLGFVWVAHPQKGVFRIRLNDAKDSVVHMDSFSDEFKNFGLAKVFKINNRIVFTSEQGFFTFDDVADSIRPFVSLNNTLKEYSQATKISLFEKNYYWFVSNNKVALYKISIDFAATKVSEFLINGSNMPESDLNIISLDKNKYMVSNRNGFAILDDNNSLQQSDFSRFFIKSMVFHGKNRSLKYCTDFAQIQVPFSANNVSVSFSDPVGAAQNMAEYNYRIKEIEEDWNTTQQNEIRYFHLKYGEYHFEIKPAGEFESIVIPFQIKPPWYFTKWSFVIYTFLSLALLLGLNFLFKNKIKKQKQLLEFEVRQTSLENKLQNKNMELMLTLRYLIQKNEVLHELKNDIDAYKENTVNYPIKFLKKLDSNISKGLDLQTREWKMALNNLKLSQEGYFKKLKEKHPVLTTNDIRMCSYLRMNFNSKEISQLLNLSLRAVEISRYRLRKKLKLSHDQNLTEFLMQDEF